MTALQAVGFFVGIPLALAAVIAIFVYAGSWMRRPDDEAEGGPMLVVSASAVPDPAAVPRELASGITTAYAGGGCSGRW